MTFNPSMLTLAREARRLTQSALATKAGVTPSLISKVEHGVIEVTDERLGGLASTLGYPISFFSQTGELRGASCLHHRKRSSTPVVKLREIHARVEIVRRGVDALLRHVDFAAPMSFRALDPDDVPGGVEEVAQTVRAAWRVPLGPISNLVEVIEAAGGIVVRTDLGTEKVDALSTWPATGVPLFVLNTSAPGDRQRFSLAHELGHVVMHHTPSPDQEREAHDFAAEFLMPRHEIAPELQGLRLRDLGDLKRRWKVSMAAIVKHASRIGAITDSRSTNLFIELSRLGYRKHEPIEIPAEPTRTISEIIGVYREQMGFSVADLAHATRLLPDEFADTYLGKSKHPKRLRVVGS